MKKTSSLLMKLVIVALCFFFLTVPSYAVTLNFETEADGTPFSGQSDSFFDDEYEFIGVFISDSAPSTGLTYVNLINPLNSGTSISGYYLNVGAFTDVATYLDFSFGTDVSDVAFDFASPGGNVNLLAYDAADNLISNTFVIGSDTFFNQAGFPQYSGSALIASVGPIARVRVYAGSNEALILDNLTFNNVAVPEPGTLVLISTGMIGLLALRRKIYT